MQNGRMPDQYAYACPYKEKDNGRFVGGEPSMKTLGGPNGSPSICLLHQKGKTLSEWASFDPVVDSI